MKKQEYLLALDKAVKYLEKYKKFVKTRNELLEIKSIQERLNSMYFELKNGKMML